LSEQKIPTPDLGEITLAGLFFKKDFNAVCAVSATTAKRFLRILDEFPVFLNIHLSGLRVKNYLSKHIPVFSTS